MFVFPILVAIGISLVVYTSRVAWRKGLDDLKRHKAELAQDPHNPSPMLIDGSELPIVPQEGLSSPVTRRTRGTNDRQEIGFPVVGY